MYYAHEGKLDRCASATTEGLVSPDRRGKNISPITISDHVRAFVKLHIESFPALTSHYCRKRTSRKYLDSNLNVSQCLICAEVAVKKKKKDETQRKFLSAGPYYIRIIIKVFINQKKKWVQPLRYMRKNLWWPHIKGTEQEMSKHDSPRPLISNVQLKIQIPLSQ